jgi:hypothetical protein
MIDSDGERLKSGVNDGDQNLWRNYLPAFPKGLIDFFTYKIVGSQ